MLEFVLDNGGVMVFKKMLDVMLVVGCFVTVGLLFFLAIANKRPKSSQPVVWEDCERFYVPKLYSAEEKNFWPANPPILLKESDYRHSPRRRIDGFLNFMEHPAAGLCDRYNYEEAYCLALAVYYLNAWRSVVIRDGLEGAGEQTIRHYFYLILPATRLLNPKLGELQEKAIAQAQRIDADLDEEIDEDEEAAELRHEELVEELKQLNGEASDLLKDSLESLGEIIGRLPNLQVVPDEEYEERLEEFFNQVATGKECLDILEQIQKNSDPELVAYALKQAEQEAQERYEFVDIEQRQRMRKGFKGVLTYFLKYPTEDIEAKESFLELLRKQEREQEHSMQRNLESPMDKIRLENKMKHLGRLALFNHCVNNYQKNNREVVGTLEHFKDFLESLSIFGVTFHRLNISKKGKLIKQTNLERGELSLCVEIQSFKKSDKREDWEEDDTQPPKCLFVLTADGKQFMIDLPEKFSPYSKGNYYILW